MAELLDRTTKLCNLPGGALLSFHCLCGHRAATTVAAILKRVDGELNVSQLPALSRCKVCRRTGAMVNCELLDQSREYFSGKDPDRR